MRLWSLQYLSPSPEEVGGSQYQALLSAGLLQPVDLNRVPIYLLVFPSYVLPALLIESHGRWKATDTAMVETTLWLLKAPPLWSSTSSNNPTRTLPLVAAWPRFKFFLQKNSELCPLKILATEDGRWRVKSECGQEAEFDAVIVATTFFGCLLGQQLVWRWSWLRQCHRFSSLGELFMRGCKTNLSFFRSWKRFLFSEPFFLQIQKHT